MQQLMKNALRSVLGKANLDIVRRLPRDLGRTGDIHPYEYCMTTLLAAGGPLHVVQVGANDGATNDPLFHFASSYPARTRMLLVEPQTALLPYLRANYSFHPDAVVFNGAVGPAGTLRMFCVAPAVWDKLGVPYAANWPLYRAPTGVTSARREHVAGWLRQHLSPGIDPEAAIEEIAVPCLTLPDLLREHDFPEQIDILQIDAEGYDDEVIFASDIGRTRPKIINYESANLSSEKARQLSQNLATRGYSLFRHGIDTLAIRTAA